MKDQATRDVERMVQSNAMKDRRLIRKMVGKGYYKYSLIALAILGCAWYFGAHTLDRPFVFPYLEDVLGELFYAVTDLHVLRNIGITFRRVFTGVLYATAIGFPLGMLMGYSPVVKQTIAPFINALRQIPTTSWVPLAIVWFGLGDGPTIFVIGFHAVFSIILNTVASIADISPDYYNAARSMGASPIGVVTDVVLPGSMSGLITGIRIALGAAWMSVV